MSRMDQPLSRRTLLRGAFAAGLSLPVLGALAACDVTLPGLDGAQPKRVPRPSYYPASYADIEAGSQAERELTIYSNMDQINWAPIFDAFREQYPWIETLSANGLGSSEVFERFYSDAATTTSPASLLVSGSPQDWIDFSDEAWSMDYTSPELDHLPDFAQPIPGVYTFSTDPILIGYNTALLDADEVPTSMAAFADLVEREPDRFRSKVTTYDMSVSFGFETTYNWLRARPDGWSIVDRLLPFTRPETSAGPMIDKISSGEYLAGFFVSSTVLLPQAQLPGAVLDWHYIDDGTPVFMRGMAIPKTAPHPNTAKLMLDYLMSHQGQIAIYNGGFTPYREDLTKREVPRTYQSMTEDLGEDNIVIVGYDKIPDGAREEHTEKWDARLGR